MRTLCILPLVALLAALLGCQNSASTQDPQPKTSPGVAAELTTESTGLTWTAPKEWKLGEKRPMRIATYVVGEKGELAVFYFGEGQGGDPDLNIDRWKRQFKLPEGSKEAVKETKREVRGMTVRIVDVRGTYTNPGGPMMESQGDLPDYRLLGAIVMGPKGSVFFKFTGPAKTVADNEKAFNALIGSLEKAK